MKCDRRWYNDGRLEREIAVARGEAPRRHGFAESVAEELGYMGFRGPYPTHLAEAAQRGANRRAREFARTAMSQVDTNALHAQIDRLDLELADDERAALIRAAVALAGRFNRGADEALARLADLALELRDGPRPQLQLPPILPPWPIA